MKNQDMKQNGGATAVDDAAAAAIKGLEKLTGLEYLTGLVKTAYEYPSHFTSAQLLNIKTLIGNNPGAAMASAALAGIALSTYLRIRMEGTKEEKDALDRKIREARRESEESSDPRSENRRRKSNRQRSFSEDGSSSSTKRRRVNKSNRRSRGSIGSRRRR
jgi:hypothetical protein